MGAEAGEGGAAPAAEVLTPGVALSRALEEAATVGYLWSSESVGYAFRYAGRIENPDRSQRIVLITDRRLGAMNRLWNPTFQGDPNNYEFSVIELRLNGKGEGEGKASLTGNLVPDAAAKIVTIESYDALPPVFRNVRSHGGDRNKTIGRIRYATQIMIRSCLSDLLFRRSRSEERSGGCGAARG